MLRTIERFLEFCRMHLQCEPGMVTTCNMITLRPLILTLTFFDACELFYLPMKTLHIPPHIVPATNDRCREISRRIVRDHPINVLKVNVSFLLRNTDQAIRFYGGVKNAILAVDIFQISDTGIPRIK